MSSDNILNKFNNDNLFKIIEKLLKSNNKTISKKHTKFFVKKIHFKNLIINYLDKNVLDNSLVEILLFELIYKNSSKINTEEIAKLLESILRNNDFQSKDIKFLEFYSK